MTRAQSQLTSDIGETGRRSSLVPRSAAVRIPELAVGAFIVAVSISGAFLWQRSVESGTAVLVTARDVLRGEVLSESDLSRIVLTTTGDIALIRASAATQVVGARVTADLRRGTPLSPDLLTSTRVVGPLEGLVGFTVSLSGAPVELAAGDSVRIFTVDADLEGRRVVSEVPGPIEVWEVSSPDPLSSERAVTVVSPIDSVPRLVGADAIHMVKVAG